MFLYWEIEQSCNKIVITKMYALLLFFNTKTESQTLEGVIMNLSELRNSLFHSSCLISGWCCWWIDGGGGSFLLDLKKKKNLRQ